MPRQPKPQNITSENQKVIQDWLVNLMRNTTKRDGLEEAERFFKELREKADDQDLIPAVVRRVYKLFKKEKERLAKLNSEKEERRWQAAKQNRAQISITKNNFIGNNNNSTNIEGDNPRYWETNNNKS